MNNFDINLLYNTRFVNTHVNRGLSHVQPSTPGTNNVWDYAGQTRTPDRGQPDHMLPSIISGTAAERTKVVMKMFFPGGGVRILRTVRTSE